MKFDLASRPSLFTSPWLLVPVVLLVANDWVLKPAFHNVVTGKLSDFAGLFAVAVFACGLSMRLRFASASLLSAAFIYWKLPASQPLIDFLNGVMPLQVGRTPDITDLLALPMIWLGTVGAPHFKAMRARTLVTSTFATLSFFCLAATTMSNTQTIRQSALILDSAATGTIDGKLEALQRVVDEIAVQHGLSCKACDPISEGRLYATADGSTLLMWVRADEPGRALSYEVRSTKSESALAQATNIRADVQSRLGAVYPMLSIKYATKSHQHRVQLGVGKSWEGTFRSYREAPNVADYERARQIVADVSGSLSLRQGTPDVYYAGALMGTSETFDRELVLTVGTADAPLAVIEIYRNSEKLADLEQSLVLELERRLKQEFGPDRAGRRCWVFSYC